MNITIEKFRQKWTNQGFEKATSVQEQVYPIIQDGKDLVAISPTGTGKTLAYAIPVLEKTKANHELQVLILAPSQELAQQIGGVVKEWGELSDLNTLVLTGGANVKRQIEKLKQKPEVIVGTPGRLLELANLKKLKLHQIQTLILDEADYLLQSEQMAGIRELARKCPSRRQVLFFSATDHEILHQVDQWFGTQSQEIRIQTQIVSGVVQHAYLLSPTRKREDMLRKLAQVEGMRALVFVSSVANAGILVEKMNYHHIPVAVLHGENSKIERKQALTALKNGEVTFLITTDLASRGLDVEDLPAVIQYDLPMTKEVYTHRAGRTGRMGKSGIVLSLTNEREVRGLKKLLQGEYELKEWSLYGGNLLTNAPVKSVDNKSSKVKNQSIKKAAPKRNKTSKALKRKKG